jgi:putative ABC transport system permease protein
VEFNKAEDKAAYGDFVASFISEQKTIGRYPRPLRYALSSPEEVIHINRQDRSEFYLFSLVGQGLLIMCLINAITLLLAKFIRHAPQVGIRRALGASRWNIFNQHLLESAFLGLAGGLLGLALTQGGLLLLKNSLKGYGNSAHATFVLDSHVMTLTLLVGLCATLLAGIYPAWQICRTPIAQQLKNS